MAKPVIIGMNNPYGSNPEHALYPLPKGAAGHRLWQMLHEATGATMRQYVNSFERVNLCLGPWNMRKARGTADALRLLYPGRTLVILGAQVRDAFGLSPAQVGDVIGEPADDDSVTLFYQVPHPSGRNPWYNNDDNRRRVVEFLGSLYRRSQESPK